MFYDYIILGAGISGVTFARLLQQNNITNFCLLEKEKEAGGLVRTKKVKDHILEIGGGHIFFTKYDTVRKFLFSHYPESNFNSFDRVSKIQIDDVIVDYPLESSIWQLPIALQNEILQSIKQIDSSTTNFTDCEKYIRAKLGNVIAEKYLLPYNAKIWGVDTKEMDTDWLYKIPQITYEEIEKTISEKSLLKEKIPASKFYYPKKGGFQELFDAIYQYVETQTALSTPVTKLRYENNIWIVNDQYRARFIINTTPWNTLQSALNPPSELQTSFDKLKSNSIVVSLFEKQYQHDWHWLYNPNLNLAHHREFYISNFAPHSNRTGVYTETNIKRWKPNPKALFEHVNECAYPIPVLGHANAIDSILKHYQSQNLYGLGRWGQWQYFNSDVCIHEALELSKRLLSRNS